MGNSVIYIPAYDAEVEYLESTGTQWIDTGFRPDSTTTSFELDISFEGTFVYSGTSKTIIQQSVIEMDNQFSMNFGDGPNQGGDIFFWFGRNYDGLGGASVITNIELTRGIFRYSQGIVSYSGTSVDVNNSSFPPTIGRREGTMCILKDLECYNARLYGVKIWDNNVLIRDFIPVRIGSVGYMYDKVTKQLFANKGTGNFILGSDVFNAVIPQQRCVLYFGGQRSVGFERIYEEYEWLKGRNGAYIDTMHPANTGEDTFIVKGRYDGTMRNPLGNEQSIFGVVEKWSYSEDGIWCYTYISGRNEVKPILLKISASPMFPDNVPIRGLTKEFIVVLKKSNSDYYAENNGQGVIYSNLGVTDKTIGNVYLFTRNTINIPTQAAERYFQGDIAYFRITDPSFTINRVNMFPVRLLQSIPAILDGNGIARQAGECGMWDKVSNKFYGNVANSGTFTVKGPKCYEEYEWLKTGSGTPYIQVANGCNTDENAYIETTYKCNYSNGGFDMVVGFSVNQNNNIGIRIFNATYGTAYGTYVDYHKTVNGVLSSCRMVAVQSNINAERYIKATLNNLIIDTTEYSSINWGSGFDNVNYLSTRLLGNQYNNNVMYKRTKIRANFKEYDLIPCKLTHGIPASMDANGIARPAGTCGMWDKVNDVFYGNVESSGSFTVSND